ncbi:AraC family transcriptional regulator [Chitinimonas taiwanensis]|uniref:AraC-type DNA-binding protein n=1 Tax=Chitinimonas taiwanensis DSM 18899 TaxID=1121279 RepID=A0A1K2HPJ6_9NEIS|nr:AraC family transcriptional regulator [Chitinimonas taiwanensis]SFZ78740.1 AraC-type DNA-binding protein [Chitinimonas taiwanensis DSM 18899]
MLAHCYSADTALIASQHQPALLLEFARSRDLPLAGLLKGSGLSEAGLLDGRQRLSPAQLLQLLGQLLCAADERGASFQLGQQWLPGHYGAASLALAQAVDLAQALQILEAEQARFCPLLGPRLRIEGELAIVYWTDSVGAGPLLPALVELHMAALTGMVRWLGGEPLPWRYYFNRTRPRELAQHAVHLGSALHFGAQFDAMVVDAHWLQRPWPRGQAAGVSLSLRQLEPLATPRSLLQALYDQLRASLHAPPSLEHSAAAFATSPATLKRHLARHGTHFQAMLDQVRTHEALFLLQFHGYDHAALAAHFGFHDARNFRRSFSRWTGLQAALLGPQLA